TAVAEHRARVERGTERRPKMLLAAADALFANDAPVLASALEKYLRRYRNKELDCLKVAQCVCVDANTLWHLARRRGLEEIPLPADVGLLIAKPWIKENRVPACFLPMEEPITPGRLDFHRPDADDGDFDDASVVSAHDETGPSPEMK